MQIAALDHRNEEFATDDRARVEVVASRTFTESVEVDVAVRVTEEAEAAAGLEQGTKAQFVAEVRFLRRVGAHVSPPIARDVRGCRLAVRLLAARKRQINRVHHWATSGNAYPEH